MTADPGPHVKCPEDCGGIADVYLVEKDVPEHGFRIMPTVTKNYRCRSCGVTCSYNGIPEEQDAPTDGDLAIASYHGRFGAGGATGAFFGLMLGAVSVSPLCDCESCIRVRIWGEKTGRLKAPEESGQTKEGKA